MSNQKIKCNDVRYRQGFIEVISGIHAEHINVEVWNVHPDWDISDKAFDDTRLDDAAFVGNVELELSAEQAKALVEQLQHSIRTLGRSTRNDA